MIEVIGKHTQSKIMTKGQRSYLLSIIADEVVDVANKEQLLICLQFADGTGVHELFADFVEVVQRITGAVLADTILQKLAAWRLEISCLRGQCYDGSWDKVRMQGFNTKQSSKGHLHPLCSTAAESNCCFSM